MEGARPNGIGCARAGVIEIHPKPGGPATTYELTQAGRELAEAIRTQVTRRSVKGYR